jgi:hypothetical protein
MYSDTCNFEDKADKSRPITTGLSKRGKQRTAVGIGELVTFICNKWEWPTTASYGLRQKNSTRKDRARMSHVLFNSTLL